jgi:hypothetical protein
MAGTRAILRPAAAMTRNPRNGDKMDRNDYFDALGQFLTRVSPAFCGRRSSRASDRGDGCNLAKGSLMSAWFSRWARLGQSWRGFMAALSVCLLPSGISPDRRVPGGAPMA